MLNVYLPGLSKVEESCISEMIDNIIFNLGRLLHLRAAFSELNRSYLYYQIICRYRQTWRPILINIYIAQHSSLREYQHPPYSYYSYMTMCVMLHFPTMIHRVQSFSKSARQSLLIHYSVSGKQEKEPIFPYFKVLTCLPCLLQCSLVFPVRMNAFNNLICPHKSIISDCFN